MIYRNIAVRKTVKVAKIIAKLSSTRYKVEDRKGSIFLSSSTTNYAIGETVHIRDGLIIGTAKSFNKKANIIEV
jgi:hypothetical protein